MTVECDVRIGKQKHSYLVHKPRESSTPQEKKAGMPREQVRETPEKATFMGEPPAFASGTEPGGRPLAVLFSTRRAEPSERDSRKSSCRRRYCGGVRRCLRESGATDRRVRRVDEGAGGTTC